MVCLLFVGVFWKISFLIFCFEGFKVIVSLVLKEYVWGILEGIFGEFIGVFLFLSEFFNYKRGILMICWVIKCSLGYK